MNPIHYKDFYKVNHFQQYPKGTSWMYSNLTGRGSRIPEIQHYVAFGFQAFFQRRWLRDFNEKFFSVSRNRVVEAYKRRLDTSLGKDAVPVDHITELHKLQYLPLLAKCLPEGTRVPMRVPVMTVSNTHRDFSWITNDQETLLSCELWHPMTSATIADYIKSRLTAWAQRTNPEMLWLVPWQGHDFSMRGHTSLESAAASGAGALLSFTGTDTIPAIDYLEDYYGANADGELIGGSVPATEHSVMCLGASSGESEVETFSRLLDTYPKGLLSVVSDTTDFFGVLTNVLPQLKDKIMARDGKLVIRPDSGNPVNVICGDPGAPAGSPEFKGAVRVLWDLFGGTESSTGFKQLDPHIGLIYGDAITPERLDEICQRLCLQGFASTNMVYGIGSYTYQYVTRDTFGFAVKATCAMVNDEFVPLFKQPKTDSGVKHSARGLLQVTRDATGQIILRENVTREEEDSGMLETVFRNSKLVKFQTLKEIRARLSGDQPQS